MIDKAFLRENNGRILSSKIGIFPCIVLDSFVIKLLKSFFSTSSQSVFSHYYKACRSHIWNKGLDDVWCNLNWEIKCLKQDSASRSVISCWWSSQNPNSPVGRARKDSTICSAKKFRGKAVAGWLCTCLHVGHGQPIGSGQAASKHCWQKLWPQRVIQIGGWNVSKLSW